MELVFAKINNQRLDPLRCCCQNVEQIASTQQQQQLTLVREGAVCRVRVDDPLVHLVLQCRSRRSGRGHFNGPVISFLYMEPPDHAGAL